jgi:hypothetical protein
MKNLFFVLLAVLGLNAHAANKNGTDLKVSGSLAKEEVAGVFSAHHLYFRSCFEKEVERNPKAKGELRFKLTINASGMVTGNKSLNETNSSQAKIVQCFVETIQKIKFPSAKGGTTAEYTYSYDAL